MQFLFQSLISCIRILAFVGISCSSLSTALPTLWTTAGSTVTLSCPVPSYSTRWIFSGYRYPYYSYDLAENCTLLGFFYEKIKLSDNCSQEVKTTYLQIVNVSNFDEGTYSCFHLVYQEWIMVWNTLIIIKGQPRFLKKDDSNIIWGIEGINLTLECMLESGSTEQLLIETEGSLEAAGGPKHLNYTLRPSRADHLNKYLCIANSSQYDNAFVDTAFLYISHIPDAPANMTISTCLYYVSITWQPGHNGNLHQVFYIQYKEEGAQVWNIIGPINQTKNADIMTYQISNIPYYKLFEIRVLAENDVGQSKYSEVVKRVPLCQYNITPVWWTEIGLKYWLLMGLISGGLILICILSHIWRLHRTHISMGATNDHQSEAQHDEISSVYYQVPVPVPPSRNNVLIVPSPIETESRNNVLGILDNNESRTVQLESTNLESSSQHNSGESLFSRNSHPSSTDGSSTGVESDDKSSDDRTISTVHENVYTSLIPDTHEDHSYNLLSVGNNIRVRDDSDYINMRI